jgi:tryptophanyl-tRNA synthetase
MNCAKKIIATLAPSYEKRSYYEAHLDEVKNILADGEQRAKTIAQKTMAEVHAAMNLG